MLNSTRRHPRSVFTTGLSLRVFWITLLVCALAALPVDAQKKRAANTKTATAQTAKNKASNAKGTANNGKKNTAKGAAKKGNTPTTSAEAKKKQQETQKEIAKTKEEIKKNEAEVKKGLSELNRLNAEIVTSKALVQQTAESVNALETQINGLETQISTSEAKLAKMRSDYLTSVKKLRARQKSNSALAFIFSAKNFSQAMQRMRYLHQISVWRSKKSAEINDTVKALSKHKEDLEKSKQLKDVALAQQVEAQNKLSKQFSRQDMLVGELKRNGQALNSHLAKKQQEANALKATIANLIAAETRKAEEARRAEEARKAAEAARKAEETRKAEEARLLAEQKAKEDAAKQDKKTEKKTETEKKADSKDYAAARKRKGRSDNSANTAATSAAATSSSKAASTAASSSKATATATSAGGNFADMRGSLPRPVSGAFRITSRFGRNSLPELPDVIYDNPGIDAETSANASALAVYGGKVSGVYVVDGYGTVIIINHGNYFTVYGNIASPAVKTGDVIKQGQTLGKLGPSDDDPSHSSIHFEVWKNRDKQNPAEWLRP